MLKPIIAQACWIRTQPHLSYHGVLAEEPKVWPQVDKRFVRQVPHDDFLTRTGRRLRLVGLAGTARQATETVLRAEATFWIGQVPPKIM